MSIHACTSNAIYCCGRFILPFFFHSAVMMVAVMDRIRSRVHFVQVHADDPYQRARKRKRKRKNRRFYFFDIHGDLLVVQYFKLLPMKRFESECFSIECTATNEWREWLGKIEKLFGAPWYRFQWNIQKKNPATTKAFYSKSKLSRDNADSLCICECECDCQYHDTQRFQTYQNEIFQWKNRFFAFFCFALNCTESGAMLYTRSFLSGSCG